MSRTLLLADDSLTIQRVIALTFADEDVQVVAAGDGDQAISLIESVCPDIVLADIGMPGRNGYEVARHIKQTPRLSHIPVILLAGAFEPVDQARAAEVGSDGVLAKPFEPQQVIARVRELLGLAKETAGQVDSVPATIPEEEPTARDAAQPAAGRPTVGELDDYFDRLDRAFESLGSGARREAEDRMEAPAEEPLSPPVPPDAPMTLPSVVPPLADLFSALLAAERSAPDSARAAWPPPAVLQQDLVEQVARRVLDRLSEDAVRKAVADLVSDTAERLIREEIERIKASIK